MKALLYRTPESQTPGADRLTACDLEVELSTHATDLLPIYRRTQPDLVLIDCFAEPMEGLQLCRLLAAESSGDTAAEIVALLDSRRPGDAVAAADAGVSEILCLPLPETIFECRIRLVRRRLAQRDARGSVSQSLALAEQRFRQLVDLSPDTVALQIDGRFVFVNPAGLELFGAESKELILGKPVIDFVAPEFRGLVEDRIRLAHAREEPVPVLEQRMIRLDGSPIDVEVVGVPSTFRGEPATQIVIRNVTKRKRTEAALRESEKRYRELIEGIPVGVYRISPSGRFLSVNRALAELLGYENAKELIDIPSSSLYTDEVDHQAWKQLMQGGQRVSDFETMIQRRDGSAIWVRSSTQAVFKDGELTGYEGIVEDITGRRWAEVALRTSEERFRSLVQNASDLISIIDQTGKVLYHSPSLVRVLGFRPRERVGASVLELLHPEDRPRLETSFLELLAEPAKVVRIEYRIHHRDGSPRVFESILTNLLDQPAVSGIVVNSRDITERKNAEEQLVHDALHDALTGLPNRVLFMDRLGHCIEKTPRHPGYRFAVLFLDLDRFKLVNDSFGHAIGDQLLIQVSERLRDCLRPTDSLARLGGDEFAVLLDDVGEAGNAVRVAGRIREALTLPFQLEGREIYSGASVGIALSTPQTRQPEELLRDADTAMYRAKGEGRGEYSIFDAEMHEQVSSQMQLETDFHKALELRQFEVLYQPIVRLDSGEISGFEALVRWRHPLRGLLLPAKFIPMAEDTGLITDLGDRVLRTACKQLAIWNHDRAETCPLFMSVNLARRQLAQPDFVARIGALVEEVGISATNLSLEITEHAIMEGSQEALATLQAVKDLGVRLCLDNFGTGHSSLSLLHRLPVDRVKIDRWFVSNVGSDPGSEELVEGVLALCRWRRIETMAVGVETEGQRSRLASLDCSFAQGIFYSPPIEARQVEELLIASPFLGTVGS